MYVNDRCCECSRYIIRFEVRNTTYVVYVIRYDACMILKNVYVLNTCRLRYTTDVVHIIYD